MVLIVNMSFYFENFNTYIYIYISLLLQLGIMECIDLAQKGVLGSWA